jgi:hypothetical protein
LSFVVCSESPVREKPELTLARSPACGIWTRSCGVGDAELPVTVRIEGHPVELPASVDLAAYPSSEKA